MMFMGDEPSARNLTEADRQAHEPSLFFLGPAYEQDGMGECHVLAGVDRQAREFELALFT